MTDSTSTFPSFTSVNVGPLCYHLCHHDDDGIEADGVERSKPLLLGLIQGCLVVIANIN